MVPGQPHSLWIVNTGGHTYVITYEGDGVTSTDEQAVISSMTFLDALPTP